ncbi:MAG TPA: tetratricopeptide repeat protein [Polyangiaceae bacterium]|jgi:hypothetical protein|nr:tetratricopeptide repeat protein [Polyangiaceae bacterium]
MGQFRGVQRSLFTWQRASRLVSLRGLALCAVALSCWVAPATAHAEGAKDKDASALNDDAIMNDYLALNLDAAVSKLQQAISLCGQSDCSPAVLAKAYRDLGIVYIAGMQKHDEALASFISALKADPTIPLDKDLSTPEAESTFAEAKAQLASETPPAEAPAKAPPAAAPSSDEVQHTPAPEQAVNTPVPVFVKLPDGVSAKVVRVRYLPFGASDWKTINLDPMNKGFGGYIPCLDVGSATGDLRYYIEVVDDDDAVVATSGSEATPHRVPIKNTLDGEPPHLPGKSAPAQCGDTADCPPEFPGCSKGNEEEEPEEKLGKPVLSWFTFTGQVDFLAMPSTQGACRSDAPANYECYYGDGQQRVVGLPAPGGANFDEPGTLDGQQGAGAVGGGLTLGTIRAIVGFERVFLDNFTGGIRLGFAFNGGPARDPAKGGKGFFPVHAELGVAYWIGSTPFARTGFRPFVRVAGGMAEVDAKLVAGIIDNRYDDANMTGGLATDPTPAVEVWKKAGKFFGSLSLGTMFAIAPNHGPILELKGMMLFPDSAMGLAGQLGYAVGF